MAFMSRQSFGAGKTDCQDMLKHMINENIVNFHRQEKRVSDNVARISIVRCEDGSLPVLTFRATGFATTFKTPNTPKLLLLAISPDSFTLEISDETPISKTVRLQNNLDCISC